MSTLFAEVSFLICLPFSAQERVHLKTAARISREQLRYVSSLNAQSVAYFGRSWTRRSAISARVWISDGATRVPSMMTRRACLSIQHSKRHARPGNKTLLIHAVNFINTQQTAVCSRVSTLAVERQGTVYDLEHLPV
jgi:hypothetical protein